MQTLLFFSLLSLAGVASASTKYECAATESSIFGSIILTEMDHSVDAEPYYYALQFVTKESLISIPHHAYSRFDGGFAMTYVDPRSSNEVWFGDFDVHRNTLNNPNFTITLNYSKANQGENHKFSCLPNS